MRRIAAALLVLVLGACSSGDDDSAADRTPTTPTTAQSARPQLQEFDVPKGSHPHDVAVSSDGIVWYTGQAVGKLGRLDPATGQVTEIPLGDGSSPHGVVVGPDGAPWVTDTGLNAIVRVDPATSVVKRYNAPKRVGMHTPAFDQKGVLWFTGNAGYYGRLNTATGAMDVFDAPEGAGPYGIAVTPSGDVYYASLQQSHLAHVDPAGGKATVIEPPTPNQGARRVWSDSKGVLWTSHWNTGQVGRYDPQAKSWKEWNLPGDDPQAYSVYVDEADKVWLTDFGANAIVRFDPATEEFTTFALPSTPGNVRQMLGRPGEVWGAESAADKLVVIRTR